MKIGKLDKLDRVGRSVKIDKNKQTLQGWAQCENRRKSDKSDRVGRSVKIGANPHSNQVGVQDE